LARFGLAKLTNSCCEGFVDACGKKVGKKFGEKLAKIWRKILAKS
jgi:hypothetical protein